MTGTGTENDPFIIYNVTDLQAIADDLDAYYELANDIEAAGVDFAMIGIGINPFTGSLDGKGYKVKNLTKTISTTGLQQWAMFYGVETATISNLTLENCSISIESTNHGASAAPFIWGCEGSSIITNCHVSGSVTAIGKRSSGYTAYAAGFARAILSVTISKCSSSVTVSANGGYTYASGFADLLTEPVDMEECFATGDVSADGYNDAVASAFVRGIWDGGGGVL